MAEFSKVSRGYIRMCESFEENCEDCPISAGSGNDIYVCRIRVLKNPKKYEDKIMKWAADHPEPVYPTWREWLIKKGLIDFKADFRALSYDPSLLLQENPIIECLNVKAREPIPADIAKSLGLEPKEG